jgi:hypothetical protein
MNKFKTYKYTDNQVFKREAFSMLIPDGWNVSGGIIWRQHATMPGAISLSLRSPDGLYELNILPSTPYYWNNSPMARFTSPEGSYYMGNEVRRPVTGYLQYLQQYVVPRGGFNTRILNSKKFIELENALKVENQTAPGCNLIIDAGVAKLEYEHNKFLFEGSISCGIVVTNMPFGQTSWIADKLISTRAPKRKMEESEKIFAVILKSFRFDLEWYNMYHQFVQYLTQYVMQDIYNAGVISRIISNAFNHVSDTAKRSHESQQGAYDKIYRGISEGIRGVSSYYDPYKGYNVEFPSDYRYVYTSPLGEYYATNNPNDNPNLGSNINWTILNKV